MKSRIALFLAAAFMSAGVASATATPFQAKLETPMPKRERVIADSTVWICESDTCVASKETRTKPSVKACKRLAKETGVLTSYSANGEALSEADLAACNTAAKK